MNHNYKLLTPGPLTTTDTVKREMLFDHCTWDDDYKAITQRIRAGLLRLAHVSEPAYTAVLMQGSGTFGVESVLTSVVGPADKLLICANGAYGLRMGDIAQHAGLNYLLYRQADNRRPEAAHVAQLLREDPAITHVAMVHSETTSGILNDIESVGRVVKEAGRTFIVDAMSSFGGVDIPVEQYGIDFLISSANKCIQGVPGFAFILARRSLLEQSAGKARSLSLDLYDQWKTMEQDGKWRFTSPTHVVLAFAKAMEELDAEGGIPARAARYAANQRLLTERFAALGFRPYLDPAVQGPIITSFFYPAGSTFTFREMYDYIKARGYVLYPGKVTEADTFRVGNIGEIYTEDIEQLAAIMADFLKEAGKWAS
nr:2-aminoethylphosphonate--pyruvate transaminase [uncultured Agathobaculum sp.]